MLLRFEPCHIESCTNFVRYGKEGEKVIQSYSPSEPPALHINRAQVYMLMGALSPRGIHQNAA